MLASPGAAARGMPTTAVQPAGVPSTSTGTSPAWASGRVGAGPSAKWAMPPGTCKRLGQIESSATATAFGLSFAAAGKATEPTTPKATCKAVRRVRGLVR